MNKFCTLAFSVAFLGSGCSSSVDTEGQVFLDKSGSVKKIAQAQIYVITEEKVIKNLRNSTEKLKTEHDKLVAQHSRNTEYLSKVAVHAAQAHGLAMAAGASMSFPSVYPGANSALASSTERMLETATTTMREAKEAFSLSESKLSGLETGSNNEFYMPFVIDGSSVAATSDGDGKFKVKLDSGKRIAIVAKKDDLAWLIWVTPKKGDQIFLTEKNLNGTQCELCVFNPTQFTSTLSFLKEAFAAAKEK
ncbi:MAG: hypothetical protein EBT07_11540 [Actinobacteria bacterium]|nr:hypothetical protein [Actinomycetota bacterium]